MKVRRVIVGKDHPGPFTLDIHRDPANVWMVLIAPCGKSPVTARPLRQHTFLKLPEALVVADRIVQLIARHRVSPGEADTDLYPVVASAN